MKMLLPFLWLLSLPVFGQQIELAVQKGHSGDITTVQFSDDGKLLGSSGTDHLIKIWHVPTGKEMASFVGEANANVTALKFSLNNDFLYARFDNGDVQVWDVASSTLKSTEHNNTLIFRDKYFIKTPDSNYFSLDRYYLRKYKLPSKRKVFSKVPIDISKMFSAVAFSDKTSRVFASCQDGSIYVYNAVTGKAYKNLNDHLASVNDVCLSPDETILASASSDRSIILWDMKTLKPARRLFSRSFRFTSLAFDPSGSVLVAGDELGRARIIDLRSSRIKVSTFDWHEKEMSAATFSPNNKFIYSAGHDNRIQTFDIVKQKTISSEPYLHYLSVGDWLLKSTKIYREPYAWVNTLSVSPESHYLAAGGAWLESILRKQPQLIFYKDLYSGNVKKIRAHQGNISSLTFVNDYEFISGNANQFVDWYFDPSTRIPYLHQNLLPKGSTIQSIVSVSHDTLLINASNALIWYDLKHNEIVKSSAHAGISMMAYDKASKQLAYSIGTDLFFELDGKTTTIPQAHTDRITGMAFGPHHSFLATSSWDATIKLWDTQKHELVVTIVPIGKKDYIVITPDGYYFGTRNSLIGIGYKFGKQFVSPEQYDLRFNRPDIVLSRLGYVTPLVVRSYQRAYQKRLQRLDFSEDQLDAQIHLPTITLPADQIPLVTRTPIINFNVRAVDNLFPIDRINLFVNNVPVYGSKGFTLIDKKSGDLTIPIRVELTPGKNKIQVSCLNEKGVESLPETFEVDYAIPKEKHNLYLVAISVSGYSNAKMNLKYAVKDGRDVVNLFSRRKEEYQKIFLDTLFNKAALKNNILAVREKLMKSHPDDEVIVYISGHGLLDSKLDFYFGTYDLNFSDPAANGVKYDDLENLLDGIGARQKLLLMDACHSGEVDKSSLRVDESKTIALNSGQRGSVTSYSYPIETTEENYQVGITTSFELMQELFSNVSKGSGAVVISAAAGNSYALESDEWHNGVFTYAIINGLKNEKADTNKDGKITVSELKDYVSKEVERLTDGQQKPTSRNENLEFDFRVW